MQETYENMDLLLKAISYSKYGWKICGDLEVLGLLLGMQPGYTKFCCLLWEWDSQTKDKQYKIKNCPMRENSVSREKSVRNQTLADRHKIWLPPLHIQLVLMKNSVKVMKKHSNGFEYLKEKFPKLSNAKLKYSIFSGLQIGDINNDDHLNIYKKALFCNIIVP
jgi:hypothetical protein